MCVDDIFEDVVGFEFVVGCVFDCNMGIDFFFLIFNEVVVKVLGLEDLIGKVIIKNFGVFDEERL